MRTTHRPTLRRRARQGLGVVGASAVAGVAMGGCGPTDVTPVAAPTPVVAAPPVLTEVRLPPLVVEDAFRWDAELRGLVTMAVELGLGDLPGVVPRVVTQAQPPSVLFAGGSARRTVDARLVARGPATALELELELCIAGAGCETTRAVGSREHPWDAVGALLDGAADTLGLEVSDATRAAWRQSGSRDPYAELITGRSAAVLYGLLPYEAPTEGARDTVTRAVLIDPGQPLAQWALARWDAGSTVDGGRAYTALQRAMLARPTSPLLEADLATLQGLSGRPAAALLTWEDLAARSPDDPRFLEPTARALLAVDRPQDARQVLQRFPPEFAWNPAVAELKVAVAERVEGAALPMGLRGPSASANQQDKLDPLLEHWQRTDSRAAEPVRRRIDLRVRSSQYADALPLVAPLRTRAPGPNVDALETALLVAVGRFDEAAAAAPDDVAARLRARASLAADPTRAPEGLATTDASAPLVRGEAALRRREPALAAAEAEARLAAAPYDADAWLLRARAAEALRRPSDAADAYGKAWESDPALAGGPVGNGRVASTFRFIEVGPVEPEAPVEGAPSEGAEPAAGPG